MTFRSIKLAAGMSLFAAMVATGVAVPGVAVLAQGQLQAVPRAGVAFTNTVTARAKVDTIDTDTRTIAFTRNDGREINCAVSDSVRNLAEIQDDSNVEITYTEIVTVLNKIDLPAAEPERVKQQIEDVIGLDASDAVEISAKSGLNIEGVLEAIVTRLPPPKGDPEAPLALLLVDSWYDPYLGVVLLVRVKDGVLKKGMKIRMIRRFHVLR